MRWLVDTPCLALGDRIIQKGDTVPAGVLPADSIESFRAKGYLSLEIPVDPEPVAKPEPKPEPKPAKKLKGDVEKNEPLPTKKRTRKKAEK